MEDKLQVVHLFLSFFSSQVRNVKTIKATTLSIKISRGFQVSESSGDGRRRRLESRENVAFWGSGRSSNLSRSRSMDFLPQKESSGTKALCALFESKATLQQGFNSSPLLVSAAATGSKTGRDCPLQDRRSHNTPSKDTSIQVCESGTLFYYCIHGSA